jgi:hypothetical protein
MSQPRKRRGKTPKKSHRFAQGERVGGTSDSLEDIVVLYDDYLIATLD